MSEGKKCRGNQCLAHERKREDMEETAEKQKVIIADLKKKLCSMGENKSGKLMPSGCAQN